MLQTILYSSVNIFRDIAFLLLMHFFLSIHKSAAYLPGSSTWALTAQMTSVQIYGYVFGCMVFWESSNPYLARKKFYIGHDKVELSCWNVGTWLLDEWRQAGRRGFEVKILGGSVLESCGTESVFQFGCRIVRILTQMAALGDDYGMPVCFFKYSCEQRHLALNEDVSDYGLPLSALEVCSNDPRTSRMY